MGRPAHVYTPVVRRNTLHVMNLKSVIIFLVWFPGGAITAFSQSAPMRPPAIPLVAHDPYFSIWSMADRLTDQNTPVHAKNGAALMRRAIK